MYDIVIVGGGFSGLVLANKLKSKGVENFALIERNERVGKKILATGNGRCNLTNLDLDVSHYHGSDPSFAEYALKKFDNRAIEGFFFEKGLLLTSENGKVYPLSKVANSVLDSLRLGLEKHFLTGRYVADIRREGGCFICKTSGGEEISAKKVALAFGGKSGQNMGTDGTSYALAQKFGHKLTALAPALVKMKTSAFGKGLKGVKHNARVDLYDDKRFIFSETGDFLITDGGVSGNAVFYLSARLAGLKKPQLKVDFIPEHDAGVILSALKNKIRSFGFLSGRELLTGYVHSALASFIAVKEGMASVSLKDLDEKSVEKAVELAKNFTVLVEGAGGFAESQVTHGGITTKDVDDKTFESKLQKGLYIIGEALDVDGDCGGYNLQFAFSSACAAAEDL